MCPVRSTWNNTSAGTAIPCARKYRTFPLSLRAEQGTQQITSIFKGLCFPLRICRSMGAMLSFQQSLQPRFHNELSETLQLADISSKGKGRRMAPRVSAPLTLVPLLPSLLKAVLAITNKHKSLVSPRKGAQFNIAPVNSYTFL